MTRTPMEMSAYRMARRHAGRQVWPRFLCKPIKLRSPRPYYSREDRQYWAYGRWAVKHERR